MEFLKLPVLGKLVEKNIMARTTRTLGTLVASGVPILEGLTITRETAGNSVFEKLYGKVSESIREGETIARPLKEYSRPGFHPVALFFWMITGAGPMIPVIFLPNMAEFGGMAAGAGAVLGAGFYMLKMNNRVVDDLDSSAAPPRQAGRLLDDRGSRLVAVRRRDAHVQPDGGAAEQERVADVVAVADEDQLAALQ